MNGAALLALQRIDSALDQLKHRRQRLPELSLRTDAAARLAEVEREIEMAERRAAAAEATIGETERASAAMTTKRTRLEAQLKTVIAPREAEALMHEIATINTQRSELDDRELEALELHAGGESDAASARARRGPAEEELQRDDVALAAARGALDDEEAGQRAAREQAASELSASDLAIYDAARAQHGGVAVAHLDGTRCDACHLDISRGEIDAIRALPVDEVAECPQCGRFLVR